MGKYCMIPLAWGILRKDEFIQTKRRIMVTGG